MGPGRVATQSVVQNLLAPGLPAAMPGVVACPPRPSKIGRLHTVRASEKPLCTYCKRVSWQNCADKWARV